MRVFLNEMLDVPRCSEVSIGAQKTNKHGQNGLSLVCVTEKMAFLRELDAQYLQKTKK